MDKKLKQSLKIAAVGREMIVLWLRDGEVIRGIAEVSADPDRVKINTIEGSIWIPLKEVDKSSRVISMRIEGESNE